MFESLERDAAPVFWQPVAATESLTQHLHGRCSAGSGHPVTSTGFKSASAKMNRQPCLREILSERDSLGENLGMFGLSHLRPCKLHLGSAQPLQVEI